MYLRVSCKFRFILKSLRNISHLCWGLTVTLRYDFCHPSFSSNHRCTKKPRFLPASARHVTSSLRFHNVRWHFYFTKRSNTFQWSPHWFYFGQMFIIIHFPLNISTQGVHGGRLVSSPASKQEANTWTFCEESARPSSCVPVASSHRPKMFIWTGKCRMPKAPVRHPLMRISRRKWMNEHIYSFRHREIAIHSWLHVTEA